MKIIKTAGRVHREKREKQLSKIKDKGYIIIKTSYPSYNSNYKIKKEKGWFKPYVMLSFPGLNDRRKYVIFEYSGHFGKKSCARRFCEELEKIAKIKIVEYI